MILINRTPLRFYNHTHQIPFHHIAWERLNFHQVCVFPWNILVLVPEASGKQMISDMASMISMLTSRGLPATDVLVAPDVADIILSNEWILKLLDNRNYPVSHGATFTIRRAEQTIFLAVPHNISFYDTLRDKMMWGIDIRS